MTPPRPLPLAELRSRYPNQQGLAQLLAELSQRPDPSAVWISRQPLELQLRALERAAQRHQQRPLPLFGVPFAVKDNIDVAQLPTTAACPAFSYVPKRSAPAVERLLDAGAICVGKTNLDQFATGLSGVRSPYGACENPFDSRYISGGSSSGSGVAVALGLCCFALGTDTAGSGRVPAALNNIVGLKPTRGLISTEGVVPACRSLDCVSIFAANAADAEQVLAVCASFDPERPDSRPLATTNVPLEPPRIGVPHAKDLQFFGDQEAARLYRRAVARQRELGAPIAEIDIGPFLAAAQLLYDGPWVAQRLEAAGSLLEQQPDSIHPAVRSILQGARQRSALEVFQGQEQLAMLAHQARREWQSMDMLLLPTTPSTWTIEQLKAAPIELNTKLGYYTNFVNLLDLAALAVPAGFRADGLPLGVTFMGQSGSDLALLRWGARSTPSGSPDGG